MDITRRQFIGRVAAGVAVTAAPALALPERSSPVLLPSQISPDHVLLPPIMGTQYKALEFSAVKDLFQVGI